jgi:hypothetical protein
MRAQIWPLLLLLLLLLLFLTFSETERCAPHTHTSWTPVGFARGEGQAAVHNSTLARGYMRWYSVTRRPGWAGVGGWAGERRVD